VAADLFPSDQEFVLEAKNLGEWNRFRMRLSCLRSRWNKRASTPLSPVRLIFAEAIMNRTRNSSFAKFSPAIGALLATVLAVSGSALAKDRKLKASEQPANVVAHLSFTGLSAVDMAIQRKVDDKYFLYVQHSREQGISLIDISNPAQPKAVGVIPWPDPAVSSRMNVTGDLAIVAENGVLPMRSSSSNDDLVLWDLSNPSTPRVVQKFSGVVKWLQDERNFIYVLNGDGLWVVSKPAERKPEQVDYSYGG
jgi:hypothetical protein